MKTLRFLVAALSAAGLLAACGGSSSDGAPGRKMTSLRIFGDSLADVGTFGFKFTVNGATSKIYAERVADLYGLPAPCPFLVATSATTFAPNPAAGCTGYAIGGGRINFTTAPTAPLSIRQQLANAAAQLGAASYGAGDMLLIDGGGNDAADVVGAFLKASSDGGASFVGLVSTLLDPAVVAANHADPDPQKQQAGLQRLGGLYMVALADAFYASIKTNALDKGASNVVVLNIPAITGTPRFQFVLDGAAASVGGGAAGDALRGQLEALFKGWISAFNTELAAKLAGNPNVVLVDFYSSFLTQLATPAQFGLSNVKTPACPVTGVDSSGLSSYDFPTCTTAALSAAPPQGQTGANWWQSYAFSDSFHPTPYGHQLVYQRISLDLGNSGRL